MAVPKWKQKKYVAAPGTRISYKDGTVVEAGEPIPAPKYVEKWLVDRGKIIEAEEAD